MKNRLIHAMLICVLLSACGHEEKKTATLLEEIAADRSGITFQNTVQQEGESNVLNYTYYFNGGGVAVGDLNNDGLLDIYFSANQVSNKLYLNKGDWKFEDITAKAGVAALKGWKTGVTMADVNQDGWLDIYVCRSARPDAGGRKNLLFINNKDLTFTEQAEAYGIADDSYSTHAAFFDYDNDGDPDLFVLNHSIPKYGGFSKLIGNLKQQKGDEFGSHLYENVNGKFTNVSEKAGLINNVLSFGLGIAVSDFNNDGWQDLYVSNDFNEEDYLYINNHNGTFTNTIKTSTGHVSLYSMGSDAADINNDGLTDLITLDMLPESNERIKMSSGDDNYDKYQLLLNAGFHDQSMRNMLQLNNGDGTFSDIGQLAGVSNTDWSWSALFTDLDGDGWKDLYVTNGYEKDYTNMQFLKFTVDEYSKAQTTGKSPESQVLINQMPSIAVGNFVYKNSGNLTFKKMNADWGVTKGIKSNGAAYGDLDNDGDPDLVVNSVNDVAMIYRNHSVEDQGGHFLSIDLAKSNVGKNVIGTKVKVYRGAEEEYFEFSPVRGFQSCSYVPITVGLASRDSADSVRVIWPDGKTKVYTQVSKQLTPAYADASSVYHGEAAPAPVFAAAQPLAWKHTPTIWNDFKRQFLLPRLYSSTGPRLATGDVNKDGLVDLYACGPQGEAGALFLQAKDGSFKETRVEAFEKDKGYQDEDAVFFDADGDGDLDLYVVSGGYQFAEGDKLLQDRLYFNDGRAHFAPAAGAVPQETLAGACAAPIDVDGDGDLDLFIGSGISPGKYPIAPASLFLINDGKGKFSDATAPVLSTAALGMIRDAQAADMDGDGKTDLVVAGEWSPVKVLFNKGGKLAEASPASFAEDTYGWWNRIIVDDFDGDGDLDIVAGNYGLNNQFNAAPEHKVSLVYKDFNNDGQVDPFFCYYIDGQSYPYASRDEALGQVSSLRPRFIDYTAYANATLETMFKPQEMEGANHLTVGLLKTSYFENNKGKFERRELPIEAQFAPVHALAAADLDGDGDKDLILGGNETDVRVRIGKTDAMHGAVLLNDGKGAFKFVTPAKSGLHILGDMRDVVVIDAQGKQIVLAGVMHQGVVRYEAKKPAAF